MSASDSYWNLYTYLIYKKFYYDEYIRRSALYERIINGVVILTTSASVTTWAIWGKYKYIWAILVGASQVLSLIKPTLHFSDHVCCLRLMQPELQKLISEMGIHWDKLDKDQIINVAYNLMDKFERQFNSLEQQFISAPDFPERGCCRKVAERNRDFFIASRHRSIEREGVQA